LAQAKTKFWILRRTGDDSEFILRPCPVLAIARESFPARMFCDSIPCGIGHWSNNNQRKVFVWQKVEMVETAVAKVGAAVKAEAVEDKGTAVAGQVARPASRPGAAGRTLRPAANRAVGFGR
jgi:hypothetical protein